MRETADLWTYERQAAAEGFAAVCGVDEAGAGPLMGPAAPLPGQSVRRR